MPLDHADHSLNTAPVAFGSLINLSSNTKERGYVYAEGFSHPDCSLRMRDQQSEPKEETQSFGDCVFEIVPKQQHKDMAKYRKSRNSAMLEGVANISSKRRDELKELHEAAKEEKQANMREFHLSRGKPITYGTLVELKHCRSGQYLGIKLGSPSSNDRHASITCLQHGSKGTVLKILPRFKSMSEGGNIHAWDTVIIENVSTAHYMHACLEGAEVNFVPHRHVSLSDREAGVGWRLEPYCMFGERVTDSAVQCGTALRLYHRETERYLTCNVKFSSGASTQQLDPSLTVETTSNNVGGGKRVLHARVTSKLHGKNKLSAQSSMSLFEIERVTEDVGGVLTWDASYRIRHIVSRMYMVVHAIGDGPEMRRVYSKKPAGSATRMFSSRGSTHSPVEVVQDMQPEGQNAQLVISWVSDHSDQSVFQFVPRYSPKMKSAPIDFDQALF
jgi:hypothetical protein